MHIILQTSSVSYTKNTEAMQFFNCFHQRPQLAVFLYYICLITTSDAFNIMEKDAPVFKGGNLRDSYFGYTVAIHSDAGSDKWIYVGAPRDNDTGLQSIDRPGVLYKCKINATSCQAIVVDANTLPENITSAGKQRFLNPGKNGQWLGGALDIDKGNIFVCAHRWYNQMLNNYFQNGMCYESDASKGTKWEKFPLLTLEGRDFENKTTSHGSVLYYAWGFGSLGIAVHFVGTDYGDVLIGTPGVQSSTGGFVHMKGNKTFYSENDRLPYNTSELIGYAISSGKYFGEMSSVFIAAGGPRLDLTGKVLFFKMNGTHYDVNQPFLTLDGDENGNMSQPGAYFGSALASADVNKDSFDDLLVGAPMYASKNAFSVEEGRVFVYLGSSVLGQFQLQKSVLNGSDRFRARFGTAIANLGDINMDGYNDIAIGAPYEDEGVGVVYIYNGYTGGLWCQFTQRISGKAVQSGLMGFGISFSRAMDTNDDKANDVAVGAFLSGNVVLLQSRPVIQLQGEIMLNNGGISTVLNLPSLQNYTLSTNRTYPYFVFEIKFKVLRSDVIQTIVLNVTARLDTLKERYQRFSFLQNNKESSEASFSLSLEQDRPVRTPPVEVLVKSTSDLVNPIMFETKYELVGFTLFNSPQRTLQPLLNLFDGSQAILPIKTITKKIEFQKDCPNNYCKTDLHLAVKADLNNDTELFIDELTFLKLNVSITKTGDPAYGTSLTIIFPKSFKYKNVAKIEGDTDVHCNFKTEDTKTNGEDASIVQSTNNIAINETVVICSYGNPMRKDGGVKFQVVLVPSINNETNFTFYFIASTQSNETIISDNSDNITLSGKRKVFTAFHGLSRPESVSMRAGRNTYEVKHIFDLLNQGPSSMPDAIMYLKYPYVALNGKAYLRLLGKPNVNSPTGSSVNCQEMNTTLSITTVKDQIHGSIDVKSLDCTIDNCSVYKCVIKHIPPRTSAVVALTFEMTIELPNVRSQGNSFNITSTATVNIENLTNMVVNTLQHVTEIRTRIIPMSPPPEPVAWWIIFVSVLGGILLIVILVLVLWKCGFFKRKKKEEMEKRKSDEAKILVKSDEITNQENKDKIEAVMTEKETKDE
ncbi:hypothetical protein ACJMK2_024058 [Sinanodonta woodiana]|uniref:Integrin alpha second immunoglobulin-like domain-containing protein n=1 Tax=Sinanodonta woodiana TaxID=1069815 RepID=A0ABD3T717_SINWO